MFICLIVDKGVVILVIFIVYIIISHVLECAIGKFHPRSHILQSETRLVEFLITMNVNPMVTFFHLTIFNVTDCVFLTLLDDECDVYVQLQNSRHGENTIFEVIVCGLV